MLVDLSHTIENGTRTYPGLPAPAISEFLSREDSRRTYAPGTEFSIGRIDMVGNTGTYLDSPFHRYPAGDDLAALTLDRIADLPGIVVRAGDSAGGALGPGIFDGLDLAGRAVLVHTGWSRHSGTDEYFAGHPHFSAAAATRLAQSRVALVGIDSLNVDGIEDGARPAHSILLAAGIPIVEHLTALDRLPDGVFRFFAVPPRVRGLGTFPVRAFAFF